MRKVECRFQKLSLEQKDAKPDAFCLTFIFLCNLTRSSEIVKKSKYEYCYMQANAKLTLLYIHMTFHESAASEQTYFTSSSLI